jgi:hypothetical protein
MIVTAGRMRLEAPALRAYDRFRHAACCVKILSQVLFSSRFAFHAWDLTLGR